MVPIDLSGRIAVVTGGTGNLGREMVRTLARAEADVAIHYHQNAAKAEELKTEIEGMGVRGMTVQADVTDLDSIMAMRDKVAEELGNPNIIVNNAVIQYNWVSVLDQAPEDYESQFESCVLHNVFMSKAFVPAMIEAKWGRVIGTNTECAMQCFPGQSAYVSGKRGMDGVMRILAEEVGVHGITVNQVAPGWTISEGQSGNTESDKGYWEKVPLKRRGTSQEIANAVLFLASDLASNITGVYLPVCGGNVMPRI